MQEKFSAPKTKEEFLARVGEVTKRGAQSVISGLDVKIKRVAGPLIAEKQFFEEVVQYHESGKIPERFSKKDEQTT